MPVSNGNNSSNLLNGVQPILEHPAFPAGAQSPEQQQQHFPQIAQPQLHQQPTTSCSYETSFQIYSVLNQKEIELRKLNKLRL